MPFRSPLRPIPLLAAALLAGAPILAPSARAAGAATLDRGEVVARRFCYACHDADGPRAHNPLLSHLDADRFGTPERAYRSIGRLEEVNALMTLPFRGSEEDRRALAAWLADASGRAEDTRGFRSRLVLGLALGAVVLSLVVTVRGQRRRRRA